MVWYGMVWYGVIVVWYGVVMVDVCEGLLAAETSRSV